MPKNLIEKTDMIGLDVCHSPKFQEVTTFTVFVVVIARYNSIAIYILMQIFLLFIYIYWKLTRASLNSCLHCIWCSSVFLDFIRFGKCSKAWIDHFRKAVRRRRGYAQRSMSFVCLFTIRSSVTFFLSKILDQCCSKSMSLVWFPVCWLRIEH